MELPRNFTIGVKLVLSFLVIFMLMGVLAYSGYYGVKTIGDKLENVLKVRILITNMLLNADRDLQQLLVVASHIELGQFCSLI